MDDKKRDGIKDLLETRFTRRQIVSGALKATALVAVGPYFLRSGLAAGEDDPNRHHFPFDREHGLWRQRGPYRDGDCPANYQ